MSHKTIAVIAVIMVAVFFSIVVVYPLIFNPSQIGTTAQKPLEIPTPAQHPGSSAPVMPPAPPTGR